MKKVNFSKKLQLNKDVISNLNLLSIKGGAQIGITDGDNCTVGTHSLQSECSAYTSCGGGCVMTCRVGHNACQNGIFENAIFQKIEPQQYANFQIMAIRG